MSKSEGRPLPQPKKAKQDLLTELNSVLSVRAEKIRLRLQDEKLTMESNIGNDMADATPHIVNENNSNLPFSDIAAVESNRSDPLSKTSHIPVSRARQKRHQVKEVAVDIPDILKLKTTTTGGLIPTIPKSSTVNIKNYRPGYNWNNGGRVKELRIRYLARKFLLLWCHNVFGRVRLSVARNHYKKRLLQSAFTEWYNHWWTIVKEWRLGIRVDCHYRYKLWLYVFMRWKQFVIARRECHAKIRKADQFYREQLLLSTWSEWKNWIIFKHNFRKLLADADKHRDGCLTRNAWLAWTAQHNAVHVRQGKMLSAVQFWSNRLQKQHWRLWKSAVEDRKNLQTKFDLATKHHNSIVVTECFRNWVLYLKHRRAKKASADFARQIYQYNLKKKSFKLMQLQWVQIRSMRQHHLKIEMLSLRFKCRWILWRWRQYGVLSKEKKSKEKLALTFYYIHLQRTCLQALRLNVVHSHIKVMRVQLASHLRNTQIQHKAWNNWKSALETREEIMIAPQTELATKHYNSKIISYSFFSLVKYAQWRKYRKEQYAKAEAHYYLHIVPKCLYHMHLFVVQEKKNRSNSIKSIAFQRYTLQQKMLHKWQQAEKLSRDERMMNRMALLHRENVIVQSFFTLWRQRLQQHLLEEKQLTEVKNYYVRSLVYKVLTRWWNLVKQKKKYKENIKKAIQFDKAKTMCKSLSHWKKWLLRRKCKKQTMRKAETYWKLKVLKKCICALKDFVGHGKVFKSLAENKYQVHRRNILRKTFCEWRSVTVYLSAQKKKVHLICSVHKRNLVHKIFHEWHKYTSTHAYKKSQTLMLLSEAKIFLQRTKLQLHFKHWVQVTDLSKNINHRNQLAVDHYNKGNLRRAMNSWKEYSRLCLRKKLLVRQSVWFHDVRLTAKHFLTWKLRLAEKQEEMQQSQVALWHWSLVLQRKVLLAWVEYVEQIKHKRGRLAAAAVSWRENLLKQACSQWLVTADSLMQMRSTMAVQHQAKTIFDSFQVVHKCALHWKVWTKKRISRQGRKKEKCVSLTLNSHEEGHPSCPPEIVMPFSLPASVTEKKLVQPQLTLLSPLKPFQKYDHSSMQGLRRPQPKRPEFLINSLKRAGLSKFIYNSDESQETFGVKITEQVQEETEDQSDIHILKIHSGCPFQPIESHQLSPCLPQDTQVPNKSTPILNYLQNDTEKTEPEYPTSQSVQNVFSFDKDSSYLTNPNEQLTLSYSQNEKNIQKQQNKHIIEDKVILLKPEDFMKKPFMEDKQTLSLAEDKQSIQIPETLYYNSLSSFKSDDENKKPKQTRMNDNFEQELSENVSEISESQDMSPKHSARKINSSGKLSSLEIEILHIRDKLKHFKYQKKQLSSLQKQYKHLSDWLKDQEQWGTQDDKDIIEASKELDMMQREIKNLQSVVNTQKPICELLAQRAQILVQMLTDTMH
ncbi:protein SFI1 [Biomphalaria glabrata]|nr:protein SFI1 [Biomphalaria glabrata]